MIPKAPTPSTAPSGPGLREPGGGVSLGTAAMIVGVTVGVPAPTPPAPAVTVIVCTQSVALLMALLLSVKSAFAEYVPVLL